MAAPLSGVVLQQPSIPEVDFKTATILKAHSLQFASGQRVDFIPIRLKRRLELIRCVCLQPCRILRYLFGQSGSPCLLARSYSLSFRDFNPRTPCGVRRPRAINRLPVDRFQSTHPLRGATKLVKGVVERD